MVTGRAGLEGKLISHFHQVIPKLIHTPILPWELSPAAVSCLGEFFLASDDDDGAESAGEHQADAAGPVERSAAGYLS